MRVRVSNRGLLAVLAALAWAGPAVGQPVASLACRLLRNPDGQNPPARTAACACAPLDRLPPPVPRLHGEPPVHVAIPKTGSTSISKTLGLPHTHLPAAMRTELADGARFGLAVVRATPTSKWTAASAQLAMRSVGPQKGEPRRGRRAYLNVLLSNLKPCTGWWLG
jgi:hypothetical protein